MEWKHPEEGVDVRRGVLNLSARRTHSPTEYLRMMRVGSVGAMRQRSQFGLEGAVGENPRGIGSPPGLYNYGPHEEQRDRCRR
jgi:hypothetical protein